jgi:cell division septal protein FtsQ
MARAASALAARLPEFRSFRRLPLISMIVLGLALIGACWAGYMWWARDLSVFRIQHVEITGVDGKEAPAIRRALSETGKQMTTLHLRKADLERAVASFPSVRSISASADFPKTLNITVNEYEPVAALVAPDGRRAAISSANTLLRTVDASTALPEVKVGGIPTNGSLEDARARRLVAALAEAPSPLRRLIERAYDSPHGLRIGLRKGPTLYFGSSLRLAAKWAAAARVLADEASTGARFIDVRLPERPVAGGFELSAGSTGSQTSP